jgi:hypothetical protein
MTRTAWAIALTGILAGCGGSGDGDPLVGTSWQIVSTASECVTATAFSSPSTYVLGLVCRLTNGNIGLQQEVGTYSISGSSLTTVAQKATCANATKVATVTFSVSGNTLTISDSNGILLFSRAPPSTGGSSGAATFGCFDSQGNFTPSPLAPI